MRDQAERPPRTDRASGEPPSAPSPPPESEAEGEQESFWSKVKRGLTGGA